MSEAGTDGKMAAAFGMFDEHVYLIPDPTSMASVAVSESHI